MAKWVIEQLSTAGYPALVLLMIVENVFPPIPSEVILPLAGYMVTQGQFSFFGVVLAGTLGCVLGAVPLYYLGKGIGEERLKAWADRHGRWVAVSRGELEQAKRWFERYGGAAVLFCRIVPGVRSLISIPAGLARMPLVSFLAYTAVGTGLWTALLAYLGCVLGQNFQQVDEYLNSASYVVLGVIVLGYIVRVFRRQRARKERVNARRTPGAEGGAGM